MGDVGYYVETNDIGQDNYYNEYDVLVQAFNDAGLGPVSPVVRIRSAMGCKLFHSTYSNFNFNNVIFELYL